jgi:putative ABC transport system permease protein
MQTMLRGVTPAAFLVHPQVRVVEGRAPEAGRDEMMIGRMTATQMGVPEEQVAVGKTIYFDKRPWTITGRFEAPNTVMESEMWLPLRDLQIAARRDNLSCVILTLDDNSDFADVDLFVKQRLDLELIAMREGEYYSKLSQFFQPIQIMVWVTALLIAMGGLFGGLNTMYAAFAMRVREMGSLQAIGYTRLSLVVSLIQESVLAASIGALLAAAIGVLFLDGLAVRFSMGAFGLTLDSTVVGLALLAGLFLGIVGALPPAWRCLRLPIAEALKSA